MCVSTLLEILQDRMAAAMMYLLQALEFQPFLRFYRAFIEGLVMRPEYVRLFQPFLRFYWTWIQGKVGHMCCTFEFQPFLRFYGCMCHSYSWWWSLCVVSTLLGILLEPGRGMALEENVFQPFLRFYSRSGGETLGGLPE